MVWRGTEIQRPTDIIQYYLSRAVQVFLCEDLVCCSWEVSLLSLHLVMSIGFIKEPKHDKRIEYLRLGL